MPRILLAFRRSLHPAVGSRAVRLACLLTLLLPLAAERASAQEPRCASEELVVLVHGLGRTKLSMTPMALALRGRGYEVLNFGYSSYGPSVADIAGRLAAAAEERREEVGATSVHFVGHSLGNILVRWVIEHERPEHLGRVVMLAPPNQGSHTADQLEGALSWLLAPLPELTTDSLSTARRIPPPQNVEFAIIAGNRDGKVSVAETVLPGAAENVVISSRHTFIMLRPNVLSLTARFLRTGSLEDPEGALPLPCPLPGMTTPPAAD